MVSAWIAADIVQSTFDVLNAPSPLNEEEVDFPWMRKHFKKQRV
jgi:hypothetical protein